MANETETTQRHTLSVLVQDVPGVLVGGALLHEVHVPVVVAAHQGEVLHGGVGRGSRAHGEPLAAQRELQESAVARGGAVPGVQPHHGVLPHQLVQRGLEPFQGLVVRDHSHRAATGGVRGGHGVRGQARPVVVLGGRQHLDDAAHRPPGRHGGYELGPVRVVLPDLGRRGDGVVALPVLFPG